MENKAICGDLWSRGIILCQMNTTQKAPRPPSTVCSGKRDSPALSGLSEDIQPQSATRLHVIRMSSRSVTWTCERSPSQVPCTLTHQHWLVTACVTGSWTVKSMGSGSESWGLHLGPTTYQLCAIRQVTAARVPNAQNGMMCLSSLPARHPFVLPDNTDFLSFFFIVYRLFLKSFYWGTIYMR